MLLLLLACITSSMGVSEGLELIRTRSRLPTPTHSHSTLYDGDDTIYVIGGKTDNSGGFQDKVIRYSLESGTVEVVGTFVNISSGSAVLADGDILYFGGQLQGPGGVLSSAVHRYSLATGLHSVIANFPRASAWNSAVWDPRQNVAYIFGGWDGGEGRPIADVYRFNARSNALQLVTLLSTPKSDTAAVWDTRRELAYVFGGYSDQGGGGTIRDILAFDQQHNEFRFVGVLPTGASTPCAGFAEIHDEAIVVDGAPDDPATFNPGSGFSQNVSVAGWERYGYMPCVYVPKLDRMYMIGGRIWTTSEVTDHISYVDLGQRR